MRFGCGLSGGRGRGGVERGQRRGQGCLRRRVQVGGFHHGTNIAEFVDEVSLEPASAGGSVQIGTGGDRGLDLCLQSIELGRTLGMPCMRVEHRGHHLQINLCGQ